MVHAAEARILLICCVANYFKDDHGMSTLVAPSMIARIVRRAFPFQVNVVSLF